jgi:peroxiredoxin
MLEKPMFNPATVQVVGISGDPVAKQKAFVEKNQVNVCLPPSTFPIFNHTSAVTC